MNYETTICIETEFGTMEDVPAVFEYTKELDPRDTQVGSFYDKWDVTANLSELAVFGGLKRADVVASCGEAEIVKIEERIAEEIATELTNGDL